MNEILYLAMYGRYENANVLGVLHNFQMERGGGWTSVPQHTHTFTHTNIMTHTHTHTDHTMCRYKGQESWALAVFLYVFQ